MAYRKFYFKNALGEQYELTNLNFKHYLNSPKGLGFEKSFATTRIGNEELVNSESYNLPTPSGELIFYDPDRTYQDYYDFVKFISYEPITFYQIPANSVEPYYISCIVVLCSKDEIKHEDAAMHCPITIHGTSMWKTSTEYSMTITNEIQDDGKYYPLVRDYYYGGTSFSNIVFTNNGTISCGFIFEVNGEVQNPQLSVYNQNGDRYGVIKLNGTFDYVKINTNDIGQEIYLERNGSVVANPTSYQDLSVGDENTIVTFFKIKVGESKMVFTCGNIETFDGSLTFKWNNNFISV